MKQILQSVLGLVLAVLIGLLGLIVYNSYNENQRQIKEQLEAEQTPEPTPTPTPAPEVVEPANAAEAKLGAFGDIVLHSGLTSQSQNPDGSYNFTGIFGGITGGTKNADYSLCTMETTFPETADYSGYPLLKSPPELASSLKSVGFDLINTATNHSVDGLQGGINHTLDVLDLNGLDHVGTYRSQEERDANSGIVVKDINGISIAFLSYTYGTNAMSVDEYPYAVNIFYNDYMDTLSDINYDRISTDMAAARALNTDLILVQMHWGLEYETAPRSYQVDLSDFLFKEGADIIIGGHPLVPEPIELRKIKNDDGTERVGLVAYSLGNLVSCMEDEYTDISVGLNITVQKDLDTGETRLRHIGYTPIKTMNMEDYGLNPGYRYAVWDISYAINSYDNGNNLGIINDEVYADMKQAVSDIHEIMGEQYDEANGGVDAAKWLLDN